MNGQMAVSKTTAKTVIAYTRQNTVPVNAALGGERSILSQLDLGHIFCSGSLVQERTQNERIYRTTPRSHVLYVRTMQQSSKVPRPRYLSPASDRHSPSCSSYTLSHRTLVGDATLSELLECSFCQPSPSERETSGPHWLRHKGDTFVARWEVWLDEYGWSLPIGFLTPKQALELGFEYLMPLDSPKPKRPI